MNRRQALIACGLMAGGFMGQFVHAKDIPVEFTDGLAISDTWTIQLPTQIVFDLGSLRELVLTKADKEIVISMDDIWDALEEI